MKKVIFLLTIVSLFFFNIIPAYASQYMANPFYAIRSLPRYEKIHENLGDSNHVYYGWSRIARNSSDSMIFTSKKGQISTYDKNPEYFLPDPVNNRLTNEIHKTSYPNSKNLLMVFFSKIQYEDARDSASDFLNMSSTEWDKNIIEPMVNMLNQHDFDGVVLDFEGFSDSKLKVKYNNFLGQLKTKLHGKQLVVCVNVPENYQGYDYEYIYSISDLMILLAYPYHHYKTYGQSEGVPELEGRIKEVDLPEAQPFGKIKNALDSITGILAQNNGENYNPGKILLGTTIEVSGWIQRELTYNSKKYTYYENIRSLDTSSRFHVSTLADLQQIMGREEYIVESNIYKYQSRTFRKTVDEGLEQGMKKIEYYYETPESIYEKYYNLVHNYKLGGITIWRIGLGNDEIWKSINNIFSVPEGGYEELPEKTDVPSNKIWTIKFNMPVDNLTLKSSKTNIAVVDSCGNLQPVIFEYNESSNSVKVSPQDCYKPGQTYFLIIGKNIRTSNSEDNYLGKPVRMKFKIKQ